MRVAIFPIHVSEVLRLPRQCEARTYEVLHLSHKIIFPKLKIWCCKMQPPSGNQRPNLLTSLMSMSLVLRLPRKMHLCRSSSNVPRLPLFWEMLKNPHVLLAFDKVHNPLRRPREMTSERPKVLRSRQFLALLTWCFAPQRRALFRHVNFQKRSERGVFCTFWLRKCAWRYKGVHFLNISTSQSVWTWCFLAFWLGNVLGATAACAFS